MGKVNARTSLSLYRDASGIGEMVVSGIYPQLKTFYGNDRLSEGGIQTAKPASNEAGFD